MALPTKTELVTLDWGFAGEPFVRTPASTTDTTTLDVGFAGEPFVGALGAVGTTNDAILTLPSLTNRGGGTGPAMDHTVALPALTLSATTDPENLGVATLTLPSLTCVASVSNIPLPALTASGAAISGAVGFASLSLPTLDNAATGDGGVLGTAAMTLPALTGSASTEPRAAIILPALAVEASAVTGMLGRAILTLHTLSLAADAETPLVGRAALTLPLPVVSGTASSGNVGTANITLASLALAAEGATGMLGTASLTLPMLSVDGSGYVEAVGTATVTLPALTLTAQGAQARSTTYSTYALQTERRALTTYSNMPIKGLAKFNGVYLAAGPGGLFVLGGDTDAGALIDASARLATTDFGDPHLKRVEAMYVNYRTDGDLNLKVILNEHEEYDYTLPAAGHTTLSAGRAKIGRGAESVYWQMELSNRDGADFAFDRIDVTPTALSRKLG